MRRAWPIATRAQQTGKLPTIGFLGAGSAATWKPWLAAFAQRLHELGWVEGRTITVEHHWAEGRGERFAEIVAEFVRLKVDVIVTAGIAVPAAKRATSAIPIVFTLSPDPVRSGLVASLARPGGNVTGLSNQSGDLVGKRLELLCEVVPGLRRLAIMANGDNPLAVLELNDAQAEARKLGLDATTWKVRGAGDIAPVIETLKGHAEALYVVSDAFATTNQVRINTFALSARLATMHANREYIETGGLMPMGQTTRTCSAAPEIMSTRSYAARNRPTCRSSSRRNSTWSSISGPRRGSASTCLRHCLPAPTR